MTTRTPLYLALASLTALLTACGGDGTEPAAPPNAVETYQVGTHPRFNPVVSDVPFNTDIIFAKAALSDGTADLGAPTDAVRAAVNQMDGFSVSAHFDVLIEGALDADSAIANRSVFLIELDAAGKDALDMKNIVGVAGVAAINTRVVSLDGGVNNALRIIPAQVLKPRTKYLVVLTNDLLDSAGKPLTRSWVYNSLRDPDYATAQGLAPLKPLLAGWETLAAGFLSAQSSGALTAGAAKDKIVLSYSFTTTDPSTALNLTAAPRVGLVHQLTGAGKSLQEAQMTAQALDDAGLLASAKPRVHAISAHTGVDFSNFSASLAANVGKLYTGFINLPYYLSAPSAGDSQSWITKPWQPSLALADQLGVTVPRDLNGSYNYTYRYPFVAEQSTQSVPLQLTLPDADWIPGYAGAASCADIYEATGYPTVMYVHGITSDRTSVVALAHTLASRCIATVAIDLPLHGVPANSAFVGALNVEHSQLIPFSTLYGTNAPRERHFNLSGAAGAPAPMNFANPSAADGAGTQFINLGNLSVTRDNNRQAVMDLLNLNATLADISTSAVALDGVGLDLNRLNVVGASLGGVLGTTFAAVNAMTIASETRAGFTSAVNPIKGLVVSAGGSQLTQVLTNSDTFAPVINGGLAAAGVAVGTTNYERFLYAAQTLIDAADPVSHAGVLQALKMPVLVQQVNGDAVIPNAVAHAPLAGTAGLATLLGANWLAPGAADLSQRAGWVKLTQGGHSSLLRPEGDSPATTAELQTQVVTFVLSNQAVSVGTVSSSLIELPYFEINH